MRTPLLAMALVATAAAFRAEPLGRSSGPVADCVYEGGAVLTGVAGERFEALAIQAGSVLAVGTRAAVEEFAGPHTRRVGLYGRVLMPSLKDHHVHLLDVGLSLLPAVRSGIVDLSGARSPAEVARLIAARARRLPPGSWVVGKGWSQGAWGEKALPTHDVLTRACPSHPVFLGRVDGHAGWTNAGGLAAAGINAATRDPPGGAIVRRPDGSPSGVLLERANELVLRHVPWPADPVLTEAYRAAAVSLSGRGVTSIYDAGALAFPGVVGLDAPFEHLARLLAQADEQDPLPLCVNLMVPAPSPFATRVVEDPGARRLSRHVRVTHLKLFADGALGSRGGLLRQPYADDPSTRGVKRMSTGEIARIAGPALDSGLDVATHAIGDAALTRVLDAYASVLAARPHLDPRRLRVEHASLARAQDRARAARLGVVVVVQPGFVAPDGRGGTMEEERLGRERARDVYAFASLLAAGVRLAGSTDDFSSPGLPLAPLFSARARRMPGVDGPPWAPKEALDASSALALFSLWYAPGGGDPAGTLLPGAPADLLVVSGDPLAVSPEALLGIRVHRTVLEGVTVSDDGVLEEAATEPPVPRTTPGPTSQFTRSGRRPAAAPARGEPGP